MIDLNYSLRIAYYNALSVLSVPVYYQSVPNNANPDNYIVFRSIQNNDASTKECSQTNTSITVEIHTKQGIMNQGISADTLARDVFNVLYPNRVSPLTINGGQIVNTELLSDNTQDFVMEGGEMFISRFLTFQHIIYQVSDIS